jgi:hypothetical protein
MWRVNLHLSCGTLSLLKMRQWEDWEQRSKLPDTSLIVRIVVGLLCGLIVPWLAQAWLVWRREAPVNYNVDLPERLKSGETYEVDQSRRSDDEVCWE